MKTLVFNFVDDCFTAANGLLLLTNSVLSIIQSVKVLKELLLLLNFMHMLNFNNSCLAWQDFDDVTHATNISCIFSHSILVIPPYIYACIDGALFWITTIQKEIPMALMR